MPGTEDERVAGVLADGRAAVPVAAWFGGSLAKAQAALAEYELAVAEIERRGVWLVDTRFVQYAETAGPPPYDLEAVSSAAHAAVGDSNRQRF